MESKLTEQEIESVAETLAGKKRPGPWQEENGAGSIRRILATVFALVSGYCLVMAAHSNHEWAVWAGGVAGVITVIMVICTTVSDVVALIKAAKALREG